MAVGVRRRGAPRRAASRATISRWRRLIGASALPRCVEYTAIAGGSRKHRTSRGPRARSRDGRRRGGVARRHSHSCSDSPGSSCRRDRRDSPRGDRNSRRIHLWTRAIGSGAATTLGAGGGATSVGDDVVAERSVAEHALDDLGQGAFGVPTRSRHRSEWATSHMLRCTNSSNQIGSGDRAATTVPRPLGPEALPHRGCPVRESRTCRDLRTGRAWDRRDTAPRPARRSWRGAQRGVPRWPSGRTPGRDPPTPKQRRAKPDAHRRAGRTARAAAEQATTNRAWIMVVTSTTCFNVRPAGARRARGLVPSQTRGIRIAGDVLTASDRPPETAAPSSLEGALSQELAALAGAGLQRTLRALHAPSGCAHRGPDPGAARLFLERLPRPRLRPAARRRGGSGVAHRGHRSRGRPADLRAPRAACGARARHRAVHRRRGAPCCSPAATWPTWGRFRRSWDEGTRSIRTC